MIGHLKRLGYSLQRPRPAHEGRANAEERAAFKKLSARVAALKRQHPNTPVEAWAFDEHRLGLKPILRRLWAPRGERPKARARPRYRWL